MANDPRAWQPRTLYENGEVVVDKGVQYRIHCPEHGDACPGGGLRSGYIPPKETIEDGFTFYEVVQDA